MNSPAKMEVQITQLWGGNAIAQKHAVEGAVSFTVGGSETEIAHWQGQDLVVTPPREAGVFVDKLMMTSDAFTLSEGHTADVIVGDFTFQISVSERAERAPKAIAAAILEDSGLRTVAGSGIAHAALLAAVAFFMPSMGLADDETIDRQRMLDLKAYIQSAAEREQEAKPQDAPNQGQNDSSAADAPGGRAAKNESGAMGGEKQSEKPGHWTAKGDEKPENATLAREHALREAAEFGMIGLLAQTQSDPNAPVVPWGNVLAGSDRDSHMGNLWSGDAGDAFGFGLGLSGTGAGGGGTGEGIGVKDVGGLMGRMGECTGDPKDCTGGMAHGHGVIGGTYHPHGPRIEWKGEVTTNGRLDPAVIQRIVRLNSGRFVGCYKDGLRTNPNLQGRVAVSFIIGRDGTVTASRDTSGSDLADANVRACVVQRFYGLEFPEPAGGTVTVTYPFAFSPE